MLDRLWTGGGDYVLRLKGNQGNLHDDVKQLFDWTRRIEFKDIAHEFHQTITIDGRHGRIKIRRHWLLDGVEHLMGGGLWSGLKRVGMVESERRLPGQSTSIERRYYLVSRQQMSCSSLSDFHLSIVKSI